MLLSDYNMTISNLDKYLRLRGKNKDLYYFQMRTPKGLQFISHIDQQMSMPFDENNLLSSVLGIPMPIKSSFNVTAKATVITKEDREREAKLAQKKAEAAAKYKFLNN